MVELLIQYKYLAFFIGMFIGGDIVLITGVFLATRNYFDIRLLIVIGYLGTILSDMVWYYVGRHLTKTELLQKPFMQKRQKLVERVSALIHRYGLWAVFYSKFIYGTRTLIQIIAGIQKLNVLKYFGANSAGTLGYILLIIFLGYTLHLSTENIESILHNFALGLVVFIGFIYLISLGINKYLKKKLFEK